MTYEGGDEKPTLVQLIARFRTSSDFVQYEADTDKVKYWVSYIRTLVDLKTFEQSILPIVKSDKWDKLEDLKKSIPVENIIITIDTDVIKEKLLAGYIVISLSEYGLPCALIKATINKARDVSLPEVEFSVVGPKEAFVESLESNINLIRKRITNEKLRVYELNVGDLSKTKVAVLYVDDVCDEQNVHTMIQRIRDIKFDQISDSSFITQMISDNHNSPFPQLLDTERPDRVSSILAEGKIGVMVDGSPHVLIGPTTLVEFFSAFDDYFYNWINASFFRLIRLFAVAFSILVTPIYVATLTYHYELIPNDLLNTLISSRREVPLPPILEALFLELTIELLREAGARLPTKVGQTIGIVGGIVIGTASVEAGLTSNILLIIVALSALASFTTPIYAMGNTIRMLRFPFLFFAEWLGLLGIVLCFCFLMTHLLRLTSLGRPFLEPIYPPRTIDMKDALIRLPFSLMSKRPQQLRTEKPKRFSAKNARKNKDIDE
ncbi:spore germination protein [Metabacillus sp. HB246100]|uniref:spore germination protein n=1 Tax=Bacillus weihaiensis TaxID=1547283 RepID=UPI00235485A3|nr:spore germination protein [Bacillus weihaiensis]